MRPFRAPRTPLPGRRRRTDMPPEDLARGLTRRRERLSSSIAVDPPPWTIARMVARELGGSRGEGLRGLYRGGTGDGTVLWWPARLASHHEGRLLLGFPSSRSDPSILEVEANVHADTTIYFQFGLTPDEARTSALVEHFMSHPTISGSLDGCLASRGRLLLVDPEGRVRMSSETPGDPRRALRERRRTAWDALSAEAATMARSRKGPAPGEPARPDRRSLSTYRLWLDDALRFGDPLPLPSFRTEEGAIVLEWRGPDLRGALRFDGGTMSSRSVVRGVWREHGPVDVSTPSRMWKRSLHVDEIHSMTDAEPRAAAAPPSPLHIVVRDV